MEIKYITPKYKLHEKINAKEKHWLIADYLIVDYGDNYQIFYCLIDLDWTELWKVTEKDLDYFIEQESI